MDDPPAAGDRESPLDELPAPEACDGAPLAPGAAVIRRLTLEEYGNTVEAALGVDLRVAIADLPPDLRADGFRNNHATLIVSSQLARGFLDLAEESVMSMDRNAFIERHAPCTDIEARCIDAFVEAAAQTILRGALQGEEQSRYAALFEGDSVADFAEGAGRALEAMLSSPRFVYRVEDESGFGVGEVAPLELAGRLAYTLWAHPPDDTLREAALGGELDDVLGGETQARRMLGDPRAAGAMDRFFADWLNLDVVVQLGRNAERYPEFDGALAEDMRKATLALTRELALGDAPLLDLFVSRATYATPKLATLMGLTPLGEGMRRYTLPEGDRVGLLTQPAVLTAHAGGDEPSVVRRGLFVFEEILCDHMSPPPESVDTTRPAGLEEISERELSEQRMASDVCGACHRQFDPMAYALDRFDGIGRSRDADPNGRRVATGGVYQDAEGNELAFTDTTEFAALLREDPRAESCVARKLSQYAWGRPLRDADGCAIREIVTDFRERGGRFADLMVAVVTHPTFRHLQADGESE